MLRKKKKQKKKKTSNKTNQQTSKTIRTNEQKITYNHMRAHT